MEAEEIINSAAAYKQSSCIMAAVLMGFIDIFKNPKSLCEASGILRMNEKQLGLFLLYCESVGLLLQRDGAWVMEKEVRDAMEKAKPFIMYERLSMEKWNKPGGICAALKGNRGKMSPGDQEVYLKAMNGMGMKLVGLYIRRKAKICRLSAILEIGSGDGELSGIIAKNMENVQIRVIKIGAAGASIPKLQNIPTEEGGKAVFEMVLLYNAVHYFTEQELKRYFRWIYCHTCKEALIAVADIFLKTDSFRNHVFLPDWITHGGNGCLFEEDVRNVAEKCGFDIVENSFVERIHMNILFLKKRRENEQTDSRWNCRNGMDCQNGIPAIDTKDGPGGGYGVV